MLKWAYKDFELGAHIGGPICFGFYFVLATLKVYRTAFRMAIYGHASEKPTKIWSNAFDVYFLQRSHFKRRSRQQQKPKPLARKYVDQEGLVRYTGTPELKKSQLLAALENWFLCRLSALLFGGLGRASGMDLGCCGKELLTKSKTCRDEGSSVVVAEAVPAGFCLTYLGLAAEASAIETKVAMGVQVAM